MIQNCYVNLLETANVTLVTGSEDPDNPLLRVYDRKTGEPFMGLDKSTLTIKIDQGAMPASADRLFIAGHNLQGVTLALEYSDDGATWTPVVPGWTQPDNKLAVVNWASCAHRFWQFVVNSPAVIPQIGELFLTETYAWERDASKTMSGPFNPLYNVKRDLTATGNVRYLQQGPPRRQRPYGVHAASEGQKNNILLVESFMGAGMPGFLYDHFGTWFFAELTKPIDIKPLDAYQRYDFKAEFVEVLS